MNFFVKLLILFLLLPCGQSLADKINFTKIQGNQRISQESINEIIDFKPGADYSFSNINNMQKKLFKTGFFKNINIKIEQNNLIINVIENPIIDFFYIDGVKNNKREDLLYEKLSLGQNKIFSDSILKKDLELIREIYHQSGFFDVKIFPKISQLKNNSINLILDIDRGNKYKINKIFFIGNKKYKSSRLIDVISSSEHGWWKFLSSTTVVDKNRIDYDINLLKNYYLDRGYYDVQILTSDINLVKSQSYADITFSINSGSKYFFDKTLIIDDEKNLSNEHLVRIKSLSNLYTSNYFSRIEIKNLLDEIYEYLKLKKIEFIKLNTKILKTDDGKIQLSIIVKKAKSNYVNMIDISGNTITEEKVIRRNLVFAEGDSFLNHKLKKSIDNLKSTGIFKDVTAKISEKNDNLVDLDIKVEEQPTGSISAGIGLGSSGSTVTTGLQERNLFGSGNSLFSNVSLGTEKISGNVNLVQPDFKSTGNQLTTGLFAISTDYSNAGYESSKYGANTSIRYQVYEDIFLSTGLSLDSDTIDTNSKASALYKSREGQYLTLKGSYGIENDKRDSKILPTSGYRYGFGQAMALPGSDIISFENSVFGSFYKPISDDYIINFKSGFSSINSIDNNDVKLSSRKFLTQTNLRGFENQGIGPKDGKDHVGGNYSMYGSVSSTFPNPLPDKWNANSIFFIDAGNVWGVDYNSSLDSDKIRSSTGVSLEWISPLGPLSFTLAETISSAPGDLEESFSFKIGSSF